MKKVLSIVILMLLYSGCSAMQKLKLSNKSSKEIGVELEIKVEEMKKRFTLRPAEERIVTAVDLKKSVVRIFVIQDWQPVSIYSIWVINTPASVLLLTASEENLKIQERGGRLQIRRVMEIV